MYTFTLPSGIEAELKEMTGQEEELLTNQRLLRSGDAINLVIKNCLVRLGDETSVTAKHVEDLLSGDRLFLLVKLRQISLGDSVDLELQCTNAVCKNRNYLSIDLEGLETTSYTEEREFAFTLPASKQVVKFTHLDGNKEKRLAALKEPNISSAMMMRIVSVDGKSPSKKILADMSMRDRSALRMEMSRVDAGIDTTVECDCEQCGTKLKTRLEAEPAFLFPGVR